MKNFHLNVYTEVAVTVSAVLADSAEEALEKVRSGLPLTDVLDNDEAKIHHGFNVKSTECTNGEVLGAAVSQLLENGDVDEGSTVYLDAEGRPSSAGMSIDLKSAYRAEKAARFMEELSSEWEILSDIVGAYNLRTLTDLMWLQHSILTGGYIDEWPGESSVRVVVSRLPSSAEWLEYIKQQS